MQQFESFSYNRLQITPHFAIIRTAKGFETHIKKEMTIRQVKALKAQYREEIYMWKKTTPPEQKENVKMYKEEFGVGIYDTRNNSIMQLTFYKDVIKSLADYWLVKEMCSEVQFPYFVKRKVYHD